MEPNELQSHSAAAEAWVVDILRRHLLEQLWPIISTIDQLVTQLIEQVDAREKLAKRYLEENHALRVEVAKLVANVEAMRNGPLPPDAVN